MVTYCVTNMITPTCSSLIGSVIRYHTPKANMADHLVGTQNELHESEVSQSLMLYLDNENTLALSPICSVFCCCAYELLGF